MAAGQRVLWPNGGLTAPRNYKEVSSGFRYTSPFGMRTHPVTGQPQTFHYGLDQIGWSEIKAPVTGTVTFAGYNGGAGNEVRIREDGTGDVFRLLHNRELWVRSGQRVSQGQSVAIMGTTGSSTGVHCHEETRPGGGAAINPFTYYANRNASSAGGGGTPLPPKPKEIKVRQYQTSDVHAKSATGVVLKPGDGRYLRTDPKQGASNASNVIGGVGPYSITPHIYAEGTPGDVVELFLVWQTDPAGKNGGPKNSNHYVERLVVDKDGQIMASREFKRAVGSAPGGTAVYLRVNADKDNKGSVKVTRLDCDAYLFTVA